MRFFRWVNLTMNLSVTNARSATCIIWTGLWQMMIIAFWVLDSPFLGWFSKLFNILGRKKLPPILKPISRKRKHAWPLKGSVNDVSQKIHCRSYRNFREVRDEMFEMIWEMKENFQTDSRQVSYWSSVQSFKAWTSSSSKSMAHLFSQNAAKLLNFDSLRLFAILLEPDVILLQRKNRSSRNSTVPKMELYWNHRIKHLKCNVHVLYELFEYLYGNLPVILAVKHDVRGHIRRFSS